MTLFNWIFDSLIKKFEYRDKMSEKLAINTLHCKNGVGP